jgi:redox-sensitive bicupin YhaK (pirin superfamily)
MSIRRVIANTTLDQQTHGRGFSSASLNALRVPLDPFLNADDFHMSQPFFPPHPHAGFSAVTWMFPDSDGAFVNRDSLGDRSIIGAGSLHWTLAGAGMMHEEVPESAGTDTHGLQLFVNLPASLKMTTPRALHVDADKVPLDSPGDGVEVRVLVGRSGAAVSHIAPLPPITMLDVRLGPNKELRHQPQAGATVVAIGWDGAGSAADGAAFGRAQAIAFERAEAGEVRFRAGASGLRFLLLAGQPIGEPVVFRGPFAMSNELQAEDAFRRYRAGDMGQLKASF